MKEGSKYYPLYSYLQQSALVEITLPLTQIETILGDSLPTSAYRTPGWWANRQQGQAQAAAWMQAGYEVETIDLTAQLITFVRPGIIYQVPASGEPIAWDATLIKALRHHTGWSQADLAAQMGMRQQTISEWETGLYLPKRSTSKFLTMIAEEAGFLYRAGPEE